MARYVTYLRLSRESKSGRNYGLDAQRRDLDLFLGQCCPDADGCEEIATFTEIQSGADDDRPELAKAIATCKAEKATLLVAKLDRLSRRVSFIASLMEQSESQGWTFKVASMPSADAFQLHIYAALAEQERRFISARTKAGLDAARARGVLLGAAGPAGAAANDQRAQAATARAQELAEHLLPLRAQGLAYGAIADQLNASQVPTPSGTGQWAATSVRRALQRLQTPAAVGDHEAVTAS